MSSYSRFIISLLLTCTVTVGLYANSTNTKLNETATVLMALDFENQNKLYESRDLLQLLFAQYEQYEYLKKILSLSIRIGDFDTVLTLTAKYKHIFKEHEEKLRRLEIMALIKSKQDQLALMFAKDLLDKFNNSINYETVATILYSQQRFKESLAYFESAYASNKKAATLLNLVNVLYAYLDQRKTAISYLETYIGLNKCDDIEVCDRLLLYYQEDKNIDGMLSILKKIYKKYKDDIDKKAKLEKVEQAIVSILKIQDINKAIEFLELNGIENVDLLSLYHQSKQYKKALILTKKLLKLTDDNKYLAQLAILQYETALNKDDILNTVIANFEIALKTVQNHQYYNFYGYILIDHNKDISKGIYWVKEALKKDPTNIAYQDSLAWGYYKNKTCKKARKIMDKIKAEIGLDDPEVKKHYEAIRGCK